MQTQTTILRIGRFLSVVLAISTPVAGCNGHPTQDMAPGGGDTVAQFHTLQWTAYPDVTTDGTVSLAWKPVTTSAVYYVARYDPGQTPSGAAASQRSTTETSFVDRLTSEGVYGYRVSTTIEQAELSSSSVAVVFAPRVSSPTSATAPATTPTVLPTPAYAEAHCDFDAPDWVRIGGACIARSTSTSAGSDGLPGTADDPENTRLLFTEADPLRRLVAWPAETLESRRASVTPGFDGLFDTADDLLAFRQLPATTTAPSMSMSLYGGRACLDGALDIPSANTLLFRDGSNRVTAVLQSAAPATDAIWFSADDAYALFATAAWSGSQPIYAHAATGVGPDTIWGSADDITSSIQTWTWSGGLPVSYALHTSAGADGVWNTADDGGTLETFFYSGSTPVSSVVRALADGSVRSGRTFQVDSAGDVIVTITWDPGGDGVFPSSDDQFVEAERYAPCPP